MSARLVDHIGVDLGSRFIEKHKGIVIRVVVIIVFCPLPDVGQPLYSGSDNDGYRFSGR
jgi:hypothetical protein